MEEKKNKKNRKCPNLKIATKNISHNQSLWKKQYCYMNDSTHMW